MKKRVIIPIICLMVVATFFAITLLNNSYAAGETKGITFEDENMYNAIKEKLADKITSSDDSSKTITMTEENIESVTTLHLEQKNIKDIKGIENFTSLVSLDIRDNQISDISAVNGLTNLIYLNLGYNKITDISAVSGLTNLEILMIDHDGNHDDILDISPLSNLTKLEGVNITSITVNDITPLKNCTNLQRLFLIRTRLASAPISENGFKDITVLGNMNNLSALEISGYGITNVDVLSNLTSLTSLELIGCDIDDEELRCISNLTNLETLYLGYVNYEGNNITNIAPLSGLVNLKTLYLGNNKISDISPLSNLNNLEIFDICRNTISAVSEDGIVKLPKIFLQAKEQNSRVYTAEDYILKNCALNSDGTSVTIDEESTSASVMISGGTANNTILKIETLNLKVSKTTEELTNQNVGVTITANKKLKPLDGWILSDDKKSLIKEYEQNTTESIKITTENGSTSIAEISITNIDKEPPVIEYSTKENEDGSLDVILKANEKVRPVDGWELSEDAMTLTKTYTEPLTEEIEIYDIAGNKTNTSIEVKFKDNKLEIEEAKEESKDNPKTGDKGIFVFVAIVGACTILGITAVYKRRIDR